MRFFVLLLFRSALIRVHPRLRSLGYSLNLSIHPASQHQPDHFVIADEGPERMLKRCRLVLLDEEVTDPGRAVTRDQREGKEPPLADDDEVNDAAECDGGANEVKQTCARTAVFRNVVWPEFSE
jgi:hypothetical protein